MKRKTTSLYIALAAVACLIILGIYVLKSPGQLSDGGGCSYNTTNYAAQIIAVDSLLANRVDITCVAFLPQFTDTLSYYLEYGHGLDVAEFREAGLSIGDSIIYREQQILTGSCNPEIYTLLLKPYPH